MDDEGKRKLQLGREQSARALPVLVLLMLVLGLRAAFRAMASDRPTACEMQPQFREETARA